MESCVYFDIPVEKLLGREPIKADMTEVFEFISGKIILVTGGGGSIGSELCRQIAEHNPKKLIIFDVYENNAYDIQMELRRSYPELDLKVLIGSVRDSRKINQVFHTYRPDVVYHAAAHKHVPLMEDSPCEAIKNNVIGTYKTAYAAMLHNCKKFVLISTDKAVNPTNIMGASKRLCEMVIQSFARKVRDRRMKDLPALFTHSEDEFENMNYLEEAAVTRERAVHAHESPYITKEGMPEKVETEFVAVRFGNVLGSNGSVIPLFKKQIMKGGPVTVTHPDVIRYFMTIPEAVSLVLLASTWAWSGEIFVLDMGEPVKIDDLAKNLIKMLGADVEIVYTGLRPGEKLYEEKLMAEEGLKRIKDGKIYIGKPVEFDVDEFLIHLKELMKLSYANKDEDIVDKVVQMVSTFKPTGRYKISEVINKSMPLEKIGV